MSVSEYTTSIDIANRALDHLGARHITSFTDGSRQAALINGAYDKLRQAELRRNLWTFATRQAIVRALTTTTFLLSPPAWKSTTIYGVGNIIADSNGLPWQSMLPVNLNRTPGSDNAWVPYFGPMSLDLYSSTTAYYPGDIVYEDGGSAGLTSMFISLANNSAVDPSTVDTYAAGTTYSKGDITRYNGANYLSLVDRNAGNTPASSLSMWDISHTYSNGNQVVWTDGRIYTGVGNGNVGNMPSLTSAFWTAASSAPYVQPWLTWTGSTSARTWSYFGDGYTQEMVSPQLIYPIGYGPTSAASARNIFRKPANYLRDAPQQPKQGGTSYLGAPSGLAYTDWEMDGRYLVSSDVGPISLRFIADCTDVTQFDPMFCEGLAARIAFELCESITQSVDKIRVCTGAYQKAMSEARLADAVESGETYPAEDDYITCRL